MKKIRIRFTDFPGPFNPTRIEKLLRQRFDVVIDEQQPDYIIHSVRGYEYLRHPQAVRIFFTGENIRPDFNLCDYAFAYDWLEFGDRYYRVPNYQLYDQYRDLCTRLHSGPPEADPPGAKAGFCNFIYTSPNGHPFRDQVFHRLSQHRRVDSPGKHLNNMPGDDAGPAYQGDWSGSKVAFQRRYKFSFAFENSSTLGYTTEKIVHAMSADTIPIYWGNPEIGREFNVRRFINCHDYPDLEAVARRVIEIDQDDALYRQILAEPFFPGNQVPDALRDERILDQFERIFAQPKEAAFRRNFHAWGAHYEELRRDEADAYRLLHGKGVASRLARILQRLA